MSYLMGGPSLRRNQSTCGQTSPGSVASTVQFTKNGPGFLRLHWMLSRPTVMTGSNVHQWPDRQRSRRCAYVPSVPLQNLGGSTPTLREAECLRRIGSATPHRGLVLAIPFQVSLVVRLSHAPEGAVKSSPQPHNELSSPCFRHMCAV